MTEASTSIFEYPQTQPTNIQDALIKGERAYTMLLKILEFVKVEVQHEGAGTDMAPSDFLNKIIGLAYEYGLTELRENALACQEAGRRG